MDNVFLLWHVHAMESGDDEKLIGVYRSEEEAKGAIGRLTNLPGFVDCPEGFLVESYELGKDHWIEGYATV
jgi:hypothetical protein